MLYISAPVGMERIWGSLPGAGDTPVGEIWWLFEKGDDSSSLQPLGGGGPPTTAAVLARRCGMPDGFPVIVKTLHTSQVLSVQVHPGKDGRGLKKDETWIVLNADSPDGAWILGGLDLDGSVSPEEVLTRGSIETALRKIPVRGGDVYHIPPGTVHALGPGLEILEVQDSCDITYRLFDWGRVKPDGRPRELHMDLALASIALPPEGVPRRIGSEWEIPAGADTGGGYSLRRTCITERQYFSPGEILFLVSGVLLLEGDPVAAPACVIADREGGELDLPRGRGYMVRPGGQ